MADPYMLSNVAKNYLCRFYEILDEMIAEMTTAELTDSISHNFIVQMIPHHRAAIEMSRNLLQYTTFIPLQNIATNIITSQTKSIENMEAALDRCSELKNTEQELRLYERRFRQITQTMFTDMGTAPVSNQINADFMREMIPHHKGAIQMSKNALSFPICPELKPILQAIIISQQEGVQQMEALLCCKDYRHTS
ncbi:DUF305 domain-containing protein [Clostridiaceae bacterium NSJ-31]|uniref:DUF305 domain-containing protein n=1 Tax=Ligaoa zhengdingensis TaxID=2763658 RepID=A0A926I4Z2_9FIRM|nr:DUF305 domain-containing protein [Ligaoa zhengdingensis]MBC8546726.1 DUF305 domain-containing protein [Ligaoa zhengdingensis]